MIQKNSNTVIILGGGLAGLSIGWELLHKGYKVTILEKEKEVGGMCRTIEKNGHYVDMGPHNLHTNYPKVIPYVKRHMKDQVVRHYPVTKLFLKNRCVSYPLKGVKAILAISLFKIPAACVSFLFARLKITFFKPDNEISFKDWITNRFGSVLYSVFFGPYSEKTWKIDPSELSSYVAKKRVPVLRFWDTIISIFKKTIRFRRDNPYGFDCYYIKKGVGNFCNHLADNILRAGGKIVTNVKIEKLGVSNRRVNNITYKIEKNIVIEDPCFVVSSIPINELIDLINEKITQSTSGKLYKQMIQSSAKELDFCAQVQLFLLVNKEKVLPSSIVYFSESKYKMTRVYEPTQFHRSVSPVGKTSICIEFTCNVNSDMWLERPEYFYNEAVRVFEEIDFLREEDIESYFTIKLPYAYPLFRVGFLERLKSIFDYLETFENLLTIGRQGLFSYINMDDCLSMSMKIADCFEELRYRGIDYKLLFGEFYACSEMEK